MGTPFNQDAGTTLEEAFAAPRIGEIIEGDVTTEESYAAILAARSRPLPVKQQQLKKAEETRNGSVNTDLAYKTLLAERAQPVAAPMKMIRLTAHMEGGRFVLRGPNEKTVTGPQSLYALVMADVQQIRQQGGRISYRGVEPWKVYKLEGGNGVVVDFTRLGV